MAVAAVAAGAILSVLVYLLTGGTLLQQKVTLYLYIPDATGLSTSTAVRVNGIDVGKVSLVQFSGSTQPNRIVRLTLNVQQEHLPDFPVDSFAQISSNGAVGEKYVDVTQGKSADRVRAGGEILYKPQPDLVKTLDLEQFVKQLRSVDATLADIEQGKGAIGQLVVGNEIYNDLNTFFRDMNIGFRAAVSPTVSFGHLVSSDEAFRKIHDPLAELDDRLGRIQAGQGPLGRMLREDGQYNYYRDQAAGLRRSIADFRAQKFLASDELYSEWERNLGAFIRKVDEVNTSRMFSSSMDYDNLTGLARQLRDTLRDLRHDPKKYLRIQLF